MISRDLGHARKRASDIFNHRYRCRLRRIAVVINNVTFEKGRFAMRDGIAESMKLPRRPTYSFMCTVFLFFCFVIRVFVVARFSEIVRQQIADEAVDSAGHLL